jgi:hypothetical protein
MKFLAKYKPKKLKSVVYKLFRRLVTGLVFALLWDRFLNTQKRYLMAEHAFFVLGAVFFALAWVNYLKIDGVKIHYLNEKKKAVRTKPKTGFLIDYAEEEPSTPDSDYDGNEDTKTSLVSNLLAGFCFILPSLFFAVFF